MAAAQGAQLGVRQAAGVHHQVENALAQQQLLPVHFGIGELAAHLGRAGEEVPVKAVEKIRAGTAASVALHYAISDLHGCS
jgi:hypothetical protein